MLIEVIADSISKEKFVQVASASRIELITGVLKGGLTSSYKLTEIICSSVTYL